MCGEWTYAVSFQAKNQIGQMVSLADFRLRCISGVVRNSCCFRTAWWRYVLQQLYPNDNDSDTCCCALWDSCRRYRTYQHRKKKRAVHLCLCGCRLRTCGSTFVAICCNYLPSLENKKPSFGSSAFHISLVAGVGFEPTTFGLWVRWNHKVLLNKTYHQLWCQLYNPTSYHEK